MRSKEQIETDYQQAALSLGHIQIQEMALEKNRQDLVKKIAELRLEVAEVEKLEKALAAAKEAEKPAEEPKAE